MNLIKMGRSLVFYVQIAFIGFFFFNCQEKQITKSLDYKLSVKEMKEDIDHYFKQMEEIHPCLYCFTPKSTLDSVKQSLLADCTTSLSVKDFYIKMMQTTYYFDAHSSSFIFPLHWDSLHLDRKNSFLPFTFRGDSVFLGKERVIAINSIPVSKLLAELNLTISSEWNEKYKENYYFLSYFCDWLVLKHNIRPPYRIELYDEEKDSVYLKEMQGLNRKERMDYFKSSPFFIREKAYTINVYPEESIALIELNTFYNKNFSAEAYRQFLKDSFDLIKELEVKSLFIDVSRNNGGNSYYGTLLLKYINHEAAQGYGKAYMNSKFYEKISLESQKIENGSLPTNNEWEEDKTGEYLKDKFFLPQEAWGFGGDLYIIQGYLTFSAPLTMISIMKKVCPFTLVGDKSGQKYPFFSFPLSFKLPNSELQCCSASMFQCFNLKDKTPFQNSDYLYPDIYYDVYTKRHLELNDLKKIIFLKKHYEQTK